MTPEDVKRFAQTVRKHVRDHVRKEREAPPLTLWLPSEGNPRRGEGFRIGAAHDANGIRVRAVDLITAAGADAAAIGRLLHMADDRSATSVFGLVVFSAGKTPLAWEVDVVAGRAGAWRRWHNTAATVAALEFVPRALERVAAMSEDERERARAQAREAVGG